MELWADCAVTGCHNKSFSLFPFPSDCVKRMMWKKILELENKSIAFSYVCILHFQEKYIDRTGFLPKLKENAVPHLIKNVETNKMDVDETESMPGPSNVRVKVEKNVEENNPINDSDDSSASYEFSSGVRVKVENNAESDESGLGSSVIYLRHNEEMNTSSSSEMREPTRNEAIEVPPERPQNSSMDTEVIQEASNSATIAASKCDKGTNTSLCSLLKKQKSTQDKATNISPRILDINSSKVKIVKKAKNQLRKRIEILKQQVKRKNAKINSMKRIIRECVNMV